MSGIAGVVRFEGAVATSNLEAMLRPMANRGPDRQTLLCEGHAGFGQALLATTLEAVVERQPWRHPDSGCIVVSDSRLDNRPELLRELGIDRHVDEVGDGELLHAAWQRWREGCADRLRGDFAFAIWHPGRHELFIARDPMGVRPLLFHFKPGHLLVFASCTEAVLAQGEVPHDLDEGRIADALIGESEGINQTCTFYTAIQRLPPAHWMLLRDGKLTQQRYWRPITEGRPSGLPSTNAEWIEAQRERLDRAVRLRLRSHLPVGSMLSGGLDSSSVVALASAACTTNKQAPFPVFSAINSSDPECSETHHIRAVIERARCSPVLIDLPEFERTRKPGPAWWDKGVEPFDSPMTLVAELYRAARDRGVVSLMDGLPADNLYTTGRHVQQLFRRGRWHEAWQAAMAQSAMAGAGNQRLQALKVMVGCVAPAPVHALRDRLQDRRDYRQLLQDSLISSEFAKHTQLWSRYRHYSRSIGGSHQWHTSGEALSCMTAPYISAAVERYNRVASLFGVEPRPPFADRELIEFQAWMPLPLRTRDGHLKWVLRQAMARDLPDTVTWRRDKSHIGWRFSLAQLRHHPLSRADLDTPPISGWLDQQRVAAAGQPTDPDADMGALNIAAALLRWQRNRSTPNPASTAQVAIDPIDM